MGLANSNSDIIVTAPQPDAVAPVFLHAAQQQGLEYHRQHLQWGQSSLRFVAADELIRGDYQADLLLIDEAAAIPAPMLAQLLRRFNRVVFAHHRPRL